MDDILPKMRMIEQGIKPNSNLIGRIKRSYRLALKEALPPEDSVLWSTVIPAKQMNIHDALVQDDDTLISMLSEPAGTDLYYGVDNLASSLMKTTPYNWMSSYDNLLKDWENLTIGLGLAKLFNEQGGSSYPDKLKPKSKSFSEILLQLNDYFNKQLKFPNPFKGEYGIDTSLGVVSYRTIQAIYQAMLVHRHTVKGCLEIGGGMGRTAYFAHQLGFVTQLLIYRWRSWARLFSCRQYWGTTQYGCWAINRSGGNK